MFKKTFTWFIIFCFLATSNYGLAQDKTTKTSDALELREGYKNIILSRTDPDSHFSYYTRIAIPEEIVGKENTILRQISTKASQELSSAEAESGTYPIGLKVFTKTIPAELGQEYLQKIQKQAPFGLKSKGDVSIENTYCSLLTDYDKTQTIDTNKGLPVVCKELDELALIKELIPPSYTLVSSMWNPTNINTFDYILPEGMANFPKRESSELAKDFIKNLNYYNSKITQYELFKRVNTNALKISISTLLSAFEYIGNVKVSGKSINPLQCSPSVTRSDCLYKYLKATYAGKLNEYFLWEIVQFHMENVQPSKTTFKQDMDKDITEFNNAVAEINYDITNARDYLWSTTGSGSTYYTSPEIRKELIKTLLTTRYGRLFVAKAFSEFVGPLDFSRQLNQLSKYNPLKGESVLTASLSELMTTTSTAINDLISDRTKYSAKKKINITADTELFGLLTEYMKTYPFAFRQYMKKDPSAIAPRSREFMVTIKLLHQVLKQEQGMAVKDYVVNGGAVILGLALMCTGVGAPYGLVVAGYASSAIIIANTVINVNDALKAKSYARKGGATGAQDIKESYEKIKQQSERITNELINGGGEAFGLALVASIAGGVKVFQLVAKAKATKYTNAVMDMINAKRFKELNHFEHFMQRGLQRMTQITNKEMLKYLAEHPIELNYIQTKLSFLDDAESKDVIKLLNSTEKPKQTLEDLVSVSSEKDEIATLHDLHKRYSQNLTTQPKSGGVVDNPNSVLFSANGDNNFVYSKVTDVTNQVGSTDVVITRQLSRDDYDKIQYETTILYQDNNKYKLGTFLYFNYGQNNDRVVIKDLFNNQILYDYWAENVYVIVNGDDFFQKFYKGAIYPKITASGSIPSNLAKVGFINQAYKTKQIEVIDGLENCFKTLRGKYQVKEEVLNSKEFKSILEQIDKANKIPIETKDGFRMKEIYKAGNTLKKFIESKTNLDVDFADLSGFFKFRGKNITEAGKIKEIGKSNLEIIRTYQKTIKLKSSGDRPNCYIANFTNYNGGEAVFLTKGESLPPIGTVIVDSKGIKWKYMGHDEHKVYEVFSRVDQPEIKVQLTDQMDTKDFYWGFIKEGEHTVFEIRNKLTNKNIEIILPNDLEWFSKISQEQAYKKLFELIASLPDQYGPYIKEVSFNSYAARYQSDGSGFVSPTKTSEIFLLSLEEGTLTHEASHLLGYSIRKWEMCPFGWEETIALDGKKYVGDHDVYSLPYNVGLHYREDFAIASAEYVQALKDGKADDFRLAYPNRSLILDYIFSPPSPSSFINNPKALYILLLPTSAVTFSVEPSEDKDGSVNLNIHDIVTDIVTEK